MENLQNFWSTRYKEGMTGWDIGYPSTPLKEYIDQLTDKTLSILIPGAGNAYEAEYLWNKGFQNVHVLDIAQEPLDEFANRVSDFPSSQLIRGDFFQHNHQYDLIFEQTFFCSFPPTIANRTSYAKQMHNLLVDAGKLVGLLFTHPLTGDMEKRPFGGTRDEYLGYLQPLFSSIYMEECYNSIPPRQGNELFFIAMK